MLNNAFVRWTLGLLTCALAIGVTPDRLIQVGVMATSLTSDHEMTRNLAHIEVAVIRLGMLLFGLAVILLLPRLSSIGQDPRVQPLLKPLPASIERYQKRALNWPLLIVALFCGAMFASVVMHPSPWMLTVEDGPFEQFTAIAFCIAGVMAVWACVRRGKQWRTLPLALLAAFFFVAAGEEISWGQRIFNHETPAFMMQYNVQQETNIHNLFGYLADHAFIAGVMLYGAVLPFICARWPEFYRLTWRLGIPVGSVGVAICFLGASLLHEWTIGRAGGAWAAVRVPEIREAVTGLAFLMLTAEVLKLEKRAAQLRQYAQQHPAEADKPAFVGPVMPSAHAKATHKP
jgi:protein-S-isoprenylcysteine O-methyltransferase Ste14